MSSAVPGRIPKSRQARNGGPTSKYAEVEDLLILLTNPISTLGLDKGLD
jgi:hypothetical protein